MKIICNDSTVLFQNSNLLRPIAIETGGYLSAANGQKITADGWSIYTYAIPSSVSKVNITTHLLSTTVSGFSAYCYFVNSHFSKRSTQLTGEYPTVINNNVDVSFFNILKVNCYTSNGTPIVSVADTNTNVWDYLQPSLFEEEHVLNWTGNSVTNPYYSVYTYDVSQLNTIRIYTTLANANDIVYIIKNGTIVKKVQTNTNEDYYEGYFYDVDVSDADTLLVDTLKEFYSFAVVQALN